MSDLLPLKLSKQAGKDLRKIRKTDITLYEKINDAIYSLQKDPLIGESKKGDLKGFSCLDVKHIRTSYRICYTLEEDDNGELVLVVMIGTRENFYPELKRYLGL
ncbi:type II toxin-antitoxin system mRNA interferase toxin, RelE/StbE family [Bacillus piscicola]|uniref:type II toxin-antitoxin system mRNA interferase toxin, RelE/StbE family n=1 Tax=Bacillus piscicola TaxID=1632684 RepID=UPI001F08F34E|nr:type II toxin-antitoxin system mRNA interferase toxin, RelE/StbE family [Bacillus piscicola]